MEKQMNSSLEYFKRQLTDNLECKPIYSDSIKRTLPTEAEEFVIVKDFNLVIESITGEHTVLGIFIENKDFEADDIKAYIGFEKDLVFILKSDEKVKYPNGNYDLKYTNLQGLIERIKGQYPEFRTKNEKEMEALQSELCDLKNQQKELLNKLKIERKRYESAEESYKNDKHELETKLKLFDKMQIVSFNNMLSRVNMTKLLSEINRIELPDKKERVSSSNFGGTEIKSVGSIMNRSFKYYLAYFQDNWFLKIRGVDFYERGPFDAPYYTEGWEGLYKFDERMGRFVNQNVDEYYNLILWKPLEEISY